MVAELTALRDQIDEVDKGAAGSVSARRMALVAEWVRSKANMACRFTFGARGLPCWLRRIKEAQALGVSPDD